MHTGPFEDLPVSQSQVIQPNGIGMLGIVTVHLEGDIDFAGADGHSPIGLIKVLLHPIKGKGHIDSLIVVASELPRQVVPSEGRRRRAGNVSVPPSPTSRVPDVPDATIPDVALRAKDEFGVAIGLIHIKFQGLRQLWLGHVESHIIPEVLNVVITTELLPPKYVRIWRRAPDVELGGTATE